MIVDLVSPWSAAIDATDSPRAQAAFQNRHASLLEALGLQRAPLSGRLPLAMSPAELRPLARRAADPDMHQTLRAALARAVDLGADGCGRVVLLAGDGAGGAVEPLPWPDGDAVLFLDRADDDRALLAALGLGIAALTRWRATDSQSPVRRLAHDPWDRWQACRDLPLREWVYIAGLGVHLGQALLPELPPHQLLGLSRAAFARLRQREKVYRAMLTADLDQVGIARVLRWLSPGAPAGARTVANVVLPPMAGYYLAWRLLAERVARVGLGKTGGAALMTPVRKRSSELKRDGLASSMPLLPCLAGLMQKNETHPQATGSSLLKAITAPNGSRSQSPYYGSPAPYISVADCLCLTSSLLPISI